MCILTLENQLRCSGLIMLWNLTQGLVMPSSLSMALCIKHLVWIDHNKMKGWRGSIDTFLKSLEH